MLRVIVIALVLIVSLHSALIGGLYALTPPPRTFAAVFVPAPAADCPADALACWQGIIPGVTPIAEARSRLAAHPWIGERFESAQAISWRWSGQQPAAIDAAHDGIVRIEGGRVTQIRVQLTLTVGDVWTAAGQPTRTRLVRPVSRSTMYQIVYYDAAGFYITNALYCPLVPRRLWTQPVTLGLGDIWLTETLNGVELRLYEQGGWWARLDRFCPL